MNYTVIKKLPAAEEIIAAFPLSAAGHAQIARDRAETRAILEGKDQRLLMIVGPCSAWPNTAVLEYAKKLAALNERVKNTLKIIMRVYIQKPRTTKGWTGPVNQPDPFAFPDIAAGVRYSREMMVKVIEMGLPIADEAVFTHNAKGFQELLTWVAIGARATEDQEHRIHASAMDCPVGMKNPTHGSLAVAVNSIIAAQHTHVAVFDGYEVQTHGNEYAHLVLRGSEQKPNYSIAHLTEVKRLMETQHIKNPAVIIDASHDNCMINGKKDPRLQPNVVNEVLDSLKSNPQLKTLVKGFMVESFLQEGSQKVEGEKPANVNLNGLSITDPCLSWERTEEMLLNLAKRPL
jgi:3-deoxy-7-phosphoheptulonate synthase